MLRGATNAIMADVATLLAELRGGQPPAEPYHPAVARRAARQDGQRAEQDGAGTERSRTERSRTASGGSRPADSAEQDGAPQAAAAGPGGLPEPGPDAEPREATPT